MCVLLGWIEGDFMDTSWQCCFLLHACLYVGCPAFSCACSVGGTGNTKQTSHPGNESTECSFTTRAIGFYEWTRSTKLNSRRLARYCFIPFHSLNSRRLTSFFHFISIPLRVFVVPPSCTYVHLFCIFRYHGQWTGLYVGPLAVVHSFVGRHQKEQINSSTACYGKGV